MTTAAKDEKLTLGWLTKMSAKMFGRLFDLSTFSSARIAALEDRLAQLDGRDDAKAARRAALSTANTACIAAGQNPLGLKLVETDAGDRIEWVDK